VRDIAGIEVLDTDAGEDGEDLRLTVTRTGVQPGQSRRTDVLLAAYFNLVNRQVLTRLRHHAPCTTYEKLYSRVYVICMLMYIENKYNTINRKQRKQHGCHGMSRKYVYSPLLLQDNNKKLIMAMR